MVSNLRSRWTVAGPTFALWTMVAASAAYWGLKLAGDGAVNAAAPIARSAAPADPAALARLLGFSSQAAQGAPAPSLSSRFVLTGVVAGHSREGAALIAVDGKPAKPFRVGAALEEGLVLQVVEGRRAVLASSMDGPAVLTLELPARK